MRSVDPDGDNASIMNAYENSEAGDEDPQDSVLGEAYGGSMPSTTLHSPFMGRGNTLMPDAHWASHSARPSPQLPSPSLTQSTAIASPDATHDVFNTKSTPIIPEGLWSSPREQQDRAPEYQAEHSNSFPEPLGHSTPPNASPAMNARHTPRSSMDSGNILSNYGVQRGSDSELDLIDSYEHGNPSRPTSIVPGDTHSITDSIVDDYGRASRMSSVLSYTSGVHKRQPHLVGPHTPEAKSQLRRNESLRNADMTDHTSLTDMYGGLYGSHDEPTASPARMQRFRNYAPAVGEMSEPDHSVVSFPDQSTDQFILPPDYQSQVFMGDTLDQIEGGDRDWDERKPKPKDHLSVRGCANMSTIVLLVLAVLMLFLGYPILRVIRTEQENRARALALGRDPDGPIQMNNASNLRTSLIDPQTPKDAYNRTRFRDGKPMVLVFSDEFNEEGRSFYPGEDPFWQAEDLHYWQTQNYEWYDPETIKTEGGQLVIKLSEKPEHALNFRGGLVTSWNKFCFTGGYIEVKLQLPGRHNASGLWPAAWTMGNLGRAGYGASTEGLWPYSYDSCDVGTMPNQTYLQSQGGGPVAADTSGHYVDQYGPTLSMLPGQRLSRCTCPNADHPGPKHADGTWVGRSAPEIDIIEAAANNGPEEHGQVSMSLQVAPFDEAYNISHAGYHLYDEKLSGHNATFNDYTGSALQQAVSTKVNTTTAAYQMTEGKYDTYGYEYEPGGGEDAYITWTVSSKPVVTLNSSAIGPNKATEIGQRLIPVEPMYILFNLGIASSFAWVNWDVISKDFPSIMRIDYVRVWQEPDKIKTSCSPPDYPTKEYIERHKEAYYNNKLTSWVKPKEEGGYDHPFPGNMLMGQC